MKFKNASQRKAVMAKLRWNMFKSDLGRVWTTEVNSPYGKKTVQIYTIERSSDDNEVVIGKPSGATRKYDMLSRQKMKELLKDAKKNYPTDLQVVLQKKAPKNILVDSNKSVTRSYLPFVVKDSKAKVSYTTDYRGAKRLIKAIKGDKKSQSKVRILR